MSQRPPASRPASRSPQDGQGMALPTVQPRDDMQQGGRPQVRQAAEQETRPPQLPLQISPPHARSLQRAVGGDESRPSGPSRDLGVHSILNPTEPEASGTSSRRPSGGVTDSPHSTTGPSSYFGASPSSISSNPFSAQQSSESQPGDPGGALARSRRILTPRSPSQSIGAGRSSGQGTFDARQSPFLPAHGRVSGSYGRPASDVPPAPTPPAQTQQRQQYGFPSTAATGTEQRAAQGQEHAPASGNTSPSISASSLNPSSQTSPASFLYQKGGPPPPTSSSYFPGSSFGAGIQQQTAGGGAMQGVQYQGPAGATEGPYSAPAPSSQGGGSSVQSGSAAGSRQASASDPIQVLTITTSSGQYQVPVDVHQASRLADEKRARNAGASARFRQRRKEKEKEASTNIEKLQQQTRDLERRVREVEHERDFYRGERDRFRDVVFRNPEMRHIAMQSPPSPLTMRATTSFQGQNQPLGGPPPAAPYQPQSERAPRRRRIDTQGEYTPSPYTTLPPASTLPPPPGYPGPMAGPPSLPPMRMEGPGPSPTTGTNPSPATPGGAHPPFDPYPRGPYERGWPGDDQRR